MVLIFARPRMSLTACSDMRLSSNVSSPAGSLMSPSIVICRPAFRHFETRTDLAEVV